MQAGFYPGAPHGLCSTRKDQINADLLEFLKSEAMDCLTRSES